MTNKHKGIPMKPWEVHAILSGRKTRFSRPVKPQPRACNHDFPEADWHNSPSDFIENKTDPGFFYCAICGNGVSPKDDFKGIKSPYKPSDVLYVKETWGPEFGHTRFLYKASHAHMERVGGLLNNKWSPSIHMPIEAARIWIEITGVQVHRLQDISEEEAAKEGVEKHEKGEVWLNYQDQHYKNTQFIFNRRSAKESFQTVWDLQYGWHHFNLQNPWIFAYTFKVISTTGRPDNQ